MEEVEEFAPPRRLRGGQVIWVAAWPRARERELARRGGVGSVRRPVAVVAPERWADVGTHLEPTLAERGHERPVQILAIRRVADVVVRQFRWPVDEAIAMYSGVDEVLKA